MNLSPFPLSLQDFSIVYEQTKVMFQSTPMHFVILSASEEIRGPNA